MDKKLTLIKEHMETVVPAIFFCTLLGQYNKNSTKPD
jgi:hypothetical protein